MDASIISLVYGRPETTVRTFNHNLANPGAKYELLVCDQGSDDEMAPPNPTLNALYASLDIKYLRRNKFNEGVARSLNQLMLRCDTNYIFFMPNDILYPEGWLGEILRHAKDIEGSGVIGFAGQDLVHPEKVVKGWSGLEYKVHTLYPDPSFEHSLIYGGTLMPRRLINTIGYFHEGYHPYAFEDADYCFRSHAAGFMNYYIPIKGEHLENDHESESPYKMNKRAAYYSNAGLHRWRMHNYFRIGFYEPAPMLRDEMK